MAAVANQNQAPVPSSGSARNSPASGVDNYSPRDASASETPVPPPVAPPASTTNSAPPPPGGAKGKSSKKKGTNNTNDPADAHKALLSKISQLEASSSENAHEAAEIEAEVKKANRDLSQLLNTMEPHNSKLDTVQRKYSELLSEMKKVEREHVKAKKRGDQLQKEKEELSKERLRERGLKEKLEKLSRELTRENKKLKEDLRDLKDSSLDRNHELHRRLEAMTTDVDDVIAERRSPERQSLDMEQDKMFREKFTSFLHQYELRELQFHALLRTKDLEIAYQVARHDQLKKAQENELSKSNQLTRQVSTFSQTENELRGQLNVYVEKFKQVEDTLNNSNDLFLTFRKEMEEMSKKTKRLEKENLTLTRKQDATNKNIVQMAEERNSNQHTMDRLVIENEKLTKLCRAMQNGGYAKAGGAAAGGARSVSGPATAGASAAHHAAAAASGAEYDDEALEGETESEYDDEEYDEEDDIEFDDDTEEEEDYEDGVDDHGLDVLPPGGPNNGTGSATAPTYGPPLPPLPSKEMLYDRPNNNNNGNAKAKATQVNGAPPDGP